MKRVRLRVGLVALGVCLLAGCAAPSRRAPATRLPPQSERPTQTLAQVVGQINRNNLAIPTLFARHEMTGDVVNPESGRSSYVAANGELFLRKPRELWVRGKKDFIDVFELGSTPERYWMAQFFDPKTMWWGWHRNAGKPCASAMPIRPDLLGEVLGISQIDIDLTRPPFPVMRFHPEADAYMLVWADRSADHWYATKEIWYDRQTLRPNKVILFDRNGRVVLMANLTDHRPVRLAQGPREQWPTMASRYDLYFPETGTRLLMTLSDLALQTDRGQPKEGLIRFPEPGQLDVNQTIQIDRDCE